MKIKFKENQNDLFIRLEGDFGLDRIDNFKLFKRTLKDISHRDQKRVFLDLKRTYFLDSAMIAVLLVIKNKLEAGGREFHVINTSDYFSKLVQIIHLDQNLNITPQYK
ncbi:MAG: STAS domain-containing protein [Spirochaetes bacterium]|nr:STAS domain-containing protein [Spirochaetota bacterium]